MSLYTIASFQQVALIIKQWVILGHQSMRDGFIHSAEETVSKSSVLLAHPLINAVAPAADSSTRRSDDTFTTTRIVEEQQKQADVRRGVNNFENYKNDIHFHTWGAGNVNANPDCGGCKALAELHQTLKTAGFSTTAAGCPNKKLVERRLVNKTIVIVYPEVQRMTCKGGGNRVHVRWILAPLGKHKSAGTAKSWGLDDLVFNYAASTGDNIPASNILQVFTNPHPGDETDVSDEVFYSKKNRTGIAWMMRKGRLFHDEINFIHERDGMTFTEVGGDTGLSPSSFRNYEYFVTYDPYTYWSWFAAMSGTVSVVYPLANTTKEEWAMGTFIGSFLQHAGIKEIPGVAYGWSDAELNYARRTMHDLRPLLVKARQWGAETTVSRFTRDCYRFGRGERVQFEGAMLVRNAYASIVCDNQRC